MTTPPALPQAAIPALSGSGVLPPFLGSDPTVPALMSPYKTTLTELVDRFSFSAERRIILDGYLRHRAGLMALGMTGFQWLDGSFLEDIETTEGRPPGDIDCISFVHRPTLCLNNAAAWQALILNNQPLLASHLTKGQYHTDAYFVDVTIAPEQVIRQTAYWFGLFSHKRITSLWKGMLEVTLQPTADDASAIALLATK